MLDQLVESKYNGTENSRRGGFMLTTLGVMAAVLMSGWTFSLFGKSLALGSGELSLSEVVAPVPVAENPPEPQPEIKPERRSPAASNQIVLKELYTDIANSKEPPKDMTGQKSVIDATRFDLSKVKRGNENIIPESVGRGNVSQSGTSGLSSNDNNRTQPEDPDDGPKVVKPTPKQPEVPKNRPPVSIGVVNSKARNLVTPAYPPTAKMVQAQGAVNVQVVIDEQGNVISAVAATGHPLLRPAAVQAAKQSKFTPTFLSNVPVRATGVIIYNFKL